MNRRIALTLGIATAVALGSLAPAEAKAKKPKPFSGSQPYTDATPDPSATGTDQVQGCDTKTPDTYPHEAGITLSVPGPGRLSADIDNTGDWAIEIRDSKGKVLAAADDGMPQTHESVSYKVRKAGKYVIFPCNLTGAPNVTVTYAYKP